MRPDGAPIGRTLAATAKAVSSAFNAALRAEGGSIPVWLILNSLTHDRWSTQLDLARSLGIEGPTMTRHLDNLEQGGFVTRRRSETDRRAVRVELTDAGAAAQARMLGAVIAFNKRLQSGLTRDDLRRLDGILRQMSDNVSAQPRRSG
jgi:MarR family transcriptional regulator for hemolysin